MGAQARAAGAPAPATATAAAAILRQSGNIEAYLKAIDYGSKNDGLWTLPSSSRMRTFAAAMRAMLAGNYEQAARLAEHIGFQLIRYTDPARGIFYILRDTPNRDNISPGGTYVWNPRAAYPVVVEVPHPRFDSNTDQGGIELFLAARASLLLLSGTHRRSDRVQSTCEGSSSNDYRRSDASHAERHLFHVAHQEAERGLVEPLFLQLHGFGAATYTKLQRQCNHYPRGADPELLVNVSDTYLDLDGNGSSAPPRGSFARLLAETINAEGTIKACLYNEDTHSYGGTSNVQARYTNLSAHPCRQPATTNNGRFIHLEQSYNTRLYQRPLMVALITHALRAYFGR